MFAASRWFRTPKTPHSSLNLSSIARRCVEQSVAQGKSERSRGGLGRRGGGEVRATGRRSSRLGCKYPSLLALDLAHEGVPLASDAQIPPPCSLERRAHP